MIPYETIPCGKPTTHSASEEMHMDSNGHIRIYYPRHHGNKAEKETLTRYTRFFDYELGCYVDQVAITKIDYIRSLEEWTATTTVTNTLVPGFDGYGPNAYRAVLNETVSRILECEPYSSDAKRRKDERSYCESETTSRSFDRASSNQSRWLYTETSGSSE